MGRIHCTRSSPHISYVHLHRWPVRFPGQALSAFAEHVRVVGNLVGNTAVVADGDDAVAAVHKLGSECPVPSSLSGLVVYRTVAKYTHVRRIKEIRDARHVGYWFLCFVRQARETGQFPLCAFVLEDTVGAKHAQCGETKPLNELPVFAKQATCKVQQLTQSLCTVPGGSTGHLCNPACGIRKRARDLAPESIPFFGPNPEFELGEPPRFVVRPSGRRRLKPALRAAVVCSPARQICGRYFLAPGGIPSAVRAAAMIRFSTASGGGGISVNRPRVIAFSKAPRALPNLQVE